MVRSLKNFYHLLRAVLATIFFRFPAKNLFVIGVTGTDGKTTTVHLITHILKAAGKKTAMISTVSAPGFHVTTPDSWQLQGFLRKAVDEKKEYVILEATSHGLDQYRLFGCNFKMGVITNVTYEHLDYHGTWKNYLKAKARLFNGVKWAILNRDDASYKYLKSQITSNQSRVVTYSLKRKADLTPRAFKFKTNLLGEFNLYNCLAAISAVKILGIPDKKIRQSLLSFEPVSGRLEEIDEGQDFKIFIDFAHTPNAFRQILPALKKITQGKIIHVFGCTGDRERTKRPIMGEISAKFSDKIILTHEDTYSEDPKKIIAEIEPGVEKGGKILAKNYWKIEDRREAIKKAIEMAEKGDIVLVTGVGHQNSLNIGGKEISWSDQKEVRKILEK
ncbi:UDP-N-acetylmuramoyl-L-alanyl-D-glutamate--2,6-diaminopimelate ligase [Candidatus Microgenomates bacterium]|nr:UDP-N-acetylmuramoyl-L-alanyl-D-glutamate--2,6-diaminopimelate ligase [Candidatus Microgenomates bacterium]